MEQRKTSKSPCSVCLRVETIKPSGGENLFWYVIDVSDDYESTSIIKPYYKDNLKRMEKEAKRRAIREKKRDEIKTRKFHGEIIEDEVEDEDIQKLTPVCQTEDISVDCVWTTVGSMVYCFGIRVLEFSRKVRFWDLSDLSKGMNQTTPMSTRRMNGKAVTLDGNIYVFGGTKSGLSGSKPWAEVYITCKNEWKPLNQPPVILPDLFALPMQNDKTILVGSFSKRGLFSYDACKDSWDILDATFELNDPFYSDPVVVGHTLYWVGDELVHAYDLDEKVYFCGGIHFWPLKEILSRGACLIHRRLPFFHLYGETFCLIWDDIEIHDGRSRSVLVIHQLRVLKRKTDQNRGEHSLSVKALSIEYFLPHGEVVNSFDGIVLGTGSGVASGSE